MKYLISLAIAIVSFSLGVAVAKYETYTTNENVVLKTTEYKGHEYIIGYVESNKHTRLFIQPEHSASCKCYDVQ